MTLGVGIIGCANIARKTARGIGKSSDTKVVAVGSRSLAKAEKFIADEGIVGAAAYGSYEDVLADPAVGAVYLPLPTSLHLEWVQKSAAAGKHIVLEKPIALTEEDLRGILEAVREAGVQLFDGTMWLHHPRRRAIETDAFPRLGRISHASLTFTFAGSDAFFAKDIRLRSSGDALGALGDLGWYCVRAALWTYNWEAPVAVAAGPGVEWAKGDGSDGPVPDPSAPADSALTPPAPGAVPVSMSATLVFSGGRTADFYVSFRAALTSDLKVQGDQGSVLLDDFCIPHREDEGSWVVATKNALVDLDTRSSTVFERHAVQTPVPQETILWDTLAAQVAARSEALGLAEGPKGPPKQTSPLDDFWPKIAARTQRVLFAIMESARNGGAVVRYHEPAEDAL